MDNQPSTFQMVLVYFGFRFDTAIPPDDKEHRAALRNRRIAALVIVLVAVWAILASF